MPLPSKEALLHLHLGGLSYKDLGRRFGVSRKRVQQILGKVRVKRRPSGCAKFTEARVRELRGLRERGGLSPAYKNATEWLLKHCATPSPGRPGAG